MKSFLSGSSLGSIWLVGLYIYEHSYVLAAAFALWSIVAAIYASALIIRDAITAKS